MIIHLDMKTDTLPKVYGGPRSWSFTSKLILMNVVNTGSHRNMKLAARDCSIGRAQTAAEYRGCKCKMQALNWMQ